MFKKGQAAHNRRTDVIGMVCGLITIVSDDANGSKPRFRRVFGKCKCGSVKSYDLSKLIHGRTTSCGCRHSSTTHGKTKSAEYSVWETMRRRCKSPKHVSYKNYGGRGISVCEAWDKSFEAFLLDMGPRPSSNHQLDRINNDGNYEPGNCRWIDRTTNMLNRRSLRNTSGHVGVGRHVKGLWFATLTIKRQTVFKKYFKTFEEAVEARKNAEKEFGICRTD